MKVNTKKIIKALEKQAIKEYNHYAKKYPKDIGLLYDSYKALKKQEFSSDFLEGYLATISDLIIIRKGHWGLLKNK